MTIAKDLIISEYYYKSASQNPSKRGVFDDAKSSVGEMKRARQLS